MSLRRIVVVSKDPEVQQLAQEYGREVFGADNLDDALDIVQTVNPDLMLFDHRFGPRHIHELRDKSNNNSTHVRVSHIKHTIVCSMLKKIGANYKQAHQRCVSI